MLPVCPKCDAALIVLTFRGIEADMCEVCRGFWLDTGEAERILTLSGTRTDDPAFAFLKSDARQHTARLCPRCDAKLDAIRSQPGPSGQYVELDRCPKGHGVWFDCGEFERILKRFEPASNAPPAILFLRDMFAATVAPAQGTSPSDS